MTPLRKLGNCLTSCLATVLLAILELSACRPLGADALVRIASNSVAPEALRHQEPGIAHNWQPTMNAADAGSNHARRQHPEAVRELRYSLLTHCRDGPNARIGNCGI